MGYHFFFQNSIGVISHSTINIKQSSNNLVKNVFKSIFLRKRSLSNVMCFYGKKRKIGKGNPYLIEIPISWNEIGCAADNGNYICHRRAKLAEQNISTQGPIIWNNNNASLKNCKSLASFKTCLEKNAFSTITALKFKIISVHLLHDFFVKGLLMIPWYYCSIPHPNYSCLFFSPLLDCFCCSPFL